MSTKEIKSILKQAFPTTKFSVRRDSNSVTISYNNGPNHLEVKKLVAHFQYGSFDGMTDMYENDNKIEGIEQFKYVFVNREIDRSLFAEAFYLLRDVLRLAFLDGVTLEDAPKTFANNGWASQHVGTYLSACDLTSPLTADKLKAVVYG